MANYILKVFQRARGIFGRFNLTIFPDNNWKFDMDVLAHALFSAQLLTDGDEVPNDRCCRICGKIGHFVKDCPQSRRNAKKNQQNGAMEMGNLQKCYACNETGHFAKVGNLVEILSENEILFKNLNFRQKSKFCQKSKFWSKIEIFVGFARNLDNDIFRIVQIAAMAEKIVMIMIHRVQCVRGKSITMTITAGRRVVITGVANKTDGFIWMIWILVKCRHLDTVLWSFGMNRTQYRQFHHRLLETHGSTTEESISTIKGK